MRRIDRTLSVAVLVVLIAACAAPTNPSAPPPSGGAPTTASSPPPASPISSLGPQPSPSGAPAPATPTGVGHSVECNEEGTRCEIHQTDAAGQEGAGWPVTLDGPCFDLRTGSDGLAYVGCSPPAGATIHVLGLDGRPIAGWPVQVQGTIAASSWWDFSLQCGAGLSAVEVGSDGSVYVAISTGSAVALHVFNPDGAIRAGWPQTVPGDPPGQAGFDESCRGFALSDDDGVVAWGYEDALVEIQLSAGRTEFVAWSADGEMRPGWPRGSTGAASGPVLDADGGITYVSATGRVWSHDDAGEIRPGWPFVLDVPTPPFEARDGRVVLVDEVEDGPDHLIVLGRDGRPATGAPIPLPRDIESFCIFGDTPCAGFAAPAFSDDGTMYLSLAASGADGAGPGSANMAGALIAYEPDGSIVAGWPVELAERTHVFSLHVDVEDRLVARGYVCGTDSCGEGATETTLVFAADGELIDRT